MNTRKLNFSRMGLRICFILVLCIYYFAPARAQFTVKTGEVHIKANTVFSIQGLSLTPSADLPITDNIIQRSDDPVVYAGRASVNRVYMLDNPITFQGTLRFPYSDALLADVPADRMKLIYTSDANLPYQLVSETEVDAVQRFLTYDFEAPVGLQSISAIESDIEPPMVTSIQVLGTPSANAASIQFEVTFNEPPSTIAITDFTLTATGSSTGEVTSLSPVNGNSITVTITSIAGTGTLRLDVLPNSGIADVHGNGGGVNGYVEAYNSGASHTVDRDPPAVPSTVSLVSASDSGVPGDGITNENTPSLQGMAEASVFIHVKSNLDGILGTTTSNASGEWAFTPSSHLSEGTHSITVTALDAAGNESAASVPMNLTIDTQAPIGHSVSFDDLIYNSYQASSISFSFADAEIGANYNYSITSGSGGTPITGSGIISSENETVTNLNLADLNDGTITLMVSLTDVAGNAASAVTDHATLDTTPPSGHSVSFGKTVYSSSDASTASFIFATAEVGATYSYLITSSGGGTPITGSGSLTSVNEAVSNINLSGLNDGVLTLTVTVADFAGNTAPATIATATLDQTHPILSFSTPANGAVGVPVEPTITLNFSEDIYHGSGNITLFDAIDDSVVENFVISASIINGATVSLFPTEPLTPGRSYYLQIDATALTDYAGNTYSGITDNSTLRFTTHNEAPHAEDDSVTLQEDDSIVINVLSNDTDLDSYLNSASVKIVAGPNHGDVSVNSVTGVITYTPFLNFHGGDSFSYTVEDVHGLESNVAIVSVVVTPVNDAPTITGTPAPSVDQGEDYSFIPDASDIDVGDVLSFSITNKPSWADFDVSTGALTGTPGNFDVGVTLGIVIMVSDGSLSASLPAFHLTVVNVNDAPTISGTPASSVNQDETYSFIPTASDIDVGDVLSFSILNKPSWANFDASTGALTGTPGNSDVGVTTGIVITVSDGSLSASLPAFNLTVVNVNDAPTISGTPAISVDQNETYSFIPAASDIDVGDVLSFSITNKPSWANFDASTGALTGTPGNSDVGVTTGIVITVSDGNLSASLPAFNLTVVNVNDAPNISGTPAISVDQNETYSFIPAASDIDVGDVLSFSITNKPSWANFDASTGALTGTPGNSDVGVTTGIVITVSDGSLSASLPAFDLTVVNVNDAPTISGTPASSINQDEFYSFTPTASDIDVGDVLSFSIVNKPSWANFDASTGALTGTPGNSDVGVTSGIVITVSDGSLSASLPAFDLTVVNVNDAPTISGVPSASVRRGADYHFIPLAEDIDRDPLKFSIFNKPRWADFDSATGALTGVPQRGDKGLYSGIVITVSDGEATTSLPPFDIEVINAESITGITLLGATHTYNGSAKSLVIQGTLPSGTTLAYENNDQTQAGVYTVVAHIHGGLKYEDLTLTATLSIDRAQAFIEGNATQTHTYDGQAKSLSLTLNHGESVLSYAPGNSFTNAGEYTIVVSANQSTNYEEVWGTFTLRIEPAQRTLNFPVLPDKTFGDAAFASGANSSTGEPIRYIVSDPRVAEVSAEGLIRILGAGETTITASLPVNANYQTRPEVTRTLRVSKATQSITLSAPLTVSRSAGSIPLTVSASSGLGVSLSVDDPEVATLSGNSLQIHRLGSVRITATQEGNGNYEAAAPVTVTVQVKDPNAELPIQIHQALSPNGDGINDYLIIEAIKDYPDNKVRVFDHNGRMVYEASGYNNGSVAFRGVSKSGVQLAAATYFYTVEIRVNGVLKVQKRWFVLRH